VKPEAMLLVAVLSSWKLGLSRAAAATEEGQKSIQLICTKSYLKPNTLLLKNLPCVLFNLISGTGTLPVL